MNKLKSRKLWALLAGIAVNTYGARLGLSQEDCLRISGLIGTYLVGQGIADAGAGKSQTSTP